MTKAGYKFWSIRIPEWVENATRELAAKNGRSVSSEINLLMVSALARRGYKANHPEGHPAQSGAAQQRAL